MKQNTDRNRMEIRLMGGPYESGEIPLDQLVRLGAATQELVHRLGRTVSDRSGPGRTPDQLKAMTRLLVIGLHKGSTVVELAGPPLHEELALMAAPAEAGTQSLALFADTLDAVAREAPLPEVLDRASAASLRDLLHEVEEYAAVEVTVISGDEERRVRARPREASEILRRRLAADEREVARTERAMDGVLYAVNLRNGQYAIVDDAGYSIRVHVSEVAADFARSQLNQRVRVRGRFVEGRPPRLEDAILEPVEDEDDAFWRSSRPSLNLPPIQDLDGLTMHDLTEDEADTFWEALHG